MQLATTQITYRRLLVVLMHVWIHSKAAAWNSLSPQRPCLNMCLKALFPPVMSLSFHFTGPPVNVTCNIFINSFGSVTETTMVSCFGFYIDIFPVRFVNVLFIPQPAGPPVNVTCNIFINSFGSIAETTMVSGVLCKALTSSLESRLNHYVFAQCSFVFYFNSCIFYDHHWPNWRVKYWFLSPCGPL